MTNPTNDLTVIIPVKLDDPSWVKLLPDLALLAPGAEIILVSNTPQPDLFDQQIRKTGIQGHTQWIQALGPLTAQLNTAAMASTKAYLWFLLPDTQVSAHALRALEHSIEHHFFAIHFFDLHYLRDGPSVIQLNSWGNWLRAHILRLPTLRNGISLPKQYFYTLGALREDVLMGSEQHLIMKAKARGLRLRFCGESLHASSKKYQREGWCKTTLKEFTTAHREILPAVWTYLKTKLGRNSGLNLL